MTFRVRPYRRDDASALADIFARAVASVSPRHYTAEEIAVWLADAPSASDIAAKNSDGRLVFVAVDHMDKAVAWIDLEADGHIDMLFCAPEWTGKGLASSLFQALEDAARRLGLARLYVEASAVAQPVFARWGFVTVKRQDLAVAGGTIHNFVMVRGPAFADVPGSPLRT